MLIEHTFSMGDIKDDLLCCITLLNSLSEHFPDACSIISRDIATLTESTPYTSKDIHRFLENEQSLLETSGKYTNFLTKLRHAYCDLTMILSIIK
jgi:hypothetical protein